MSLDWKRIPCLAKALSMDDYPVSGLQYDDVQIRSTNERWCGFLTNLPQEACKKFRPHFGWIGSVEL